jgi:excisionase family DNA binding protein
MQQELLTATQVQDLFDVDRSTVYRMAGDGRLPAVKIGRQWRFPAEAIRKLVALPDEGFESDRFDPDPELSERLLELTAEALGVMMILTDLEGNALSPVINPCPRFEAAEDDPELVRRCTAEWRLMAEDMEPRTQFHRGPLDFLCARAFVRVGGHPKAMVLAGGIAPEGEESADLYVLTPAEQRQVMASLPKLASLMSKFDRRSVR